MDEARVGQKGRLCHRWWLKGRRPPGRRDRRFAWTYIFAAVEPSTGAGVALVLPEATTATMNLFLAEFASGLPSDVHVVLVLDRAGWHRARARAVPANVTLVPLPPYSPELNPVERVWLHLRERFLSLRVFADYRAIVDACCTAWNRLMADRGRLRSLCDQPWLQKVSSYDRRYEGMIRREAPWGHWCGSQRPFGLNPDGTAPKQRLRPPSKEGALLYGSGRWTLAN